MSTGTLDEIEIDYPESDGKPMADNTIQWNWMVRIVCELQEQFKNQQVFVAGDLFWYPVEGKPRIVVAPDGLVAFGRPPGDRGSYKQWEEGGIAPQVVFEVLSPNNDDEEMEAKLLFYQTYGVEEYYFIDPYEPTAIGYLRRNGLLEPVAELTGHVSPRLGVRFELLPDEVRMFSPTGREFLDPKDRADVFAEEQRRQKAASDEELRQTEEAYEEKLRKAKRVAKEELRQAQEAAERELRQAKAVAEDERRRAVRAESAAAAAKQRSETLRARLKERGIDPDSLGI